jgi:hypothetical protein
MDLDQILPQLLAGECPATAEDVETLKHEHDVTAVLCLQTNEEIAHGGIDWENLEACYRVSDIEIRRVPVRDCDPELLRRSLPECVRALDRLLREGHKVYIHCSMGSNRAASAVIAYLHWVQDWDLDEAVDYVTACRSWEPHLGMIQAATEDRRRASPSDSDALPV